MDTSNEGSTTTASSGEQQQQQPQGVPGTQEPPQAPSLPSIASFTSTPTASTSAASATTTTAQWPPIPNYGSLLRPPPTTLFAAPSQQQPQQPQQATYVGAQSGGLLPYPTWMSPPASNPFWPTNAAATSPFLPPQQQQQQQHQRPPTQKSQQDFYFPIQQTLPQQQHQPYYNPVQPYFPSTFDGSRFSNVMSMLQSPPPQQQPQVNLQQQQQYQAAYQQIIQQQLQQRLQVQVKEEQPHHYVAPESKSVFIHPPNVPTVRAPSASSPSPMIPKRGRPPGRGRGGSVSTMSPRATTNATAAAKRKRPDGAEGPNSGSDDTDGETKTNEPVALDKPPVALSASAAATTTMATTQKRRGRPPKPETLAKRARIAQRAIAKEQREAEKAAKKEETAKNKETKLAAKAARKTAKAERDAAAAAAGESVPDDEMEDDDDDEDNEEDEDKPQKKSDKKKSAAASSSSAAPAQEPAGDGSTTSTYYNMFLKERGPNKRKPKPKNLDEFEEMFTGSMDEDDDDFSDDEDEEGASSKKDKRPPPRKTAVKAVEGMAKELGASSSSASGAKGKAKEKKEKGKAVEGFNWLGDDEDDDDDEEDEDFAAAEASGSGSDNSGSSESGSEDEDDGEDGGNEAGGEDADGGAAAAEGDEDEQAQIPGFNVNAPRVADEEYKASLQEWREDEPDNCCVCLSPSADEENLLLFCENPLCDVVVHQHCYGVAEIPKDQWLCDKCQHREPVHCVLCPNPEGAFKPTTDGQWAHIVCALWVPGCSFADVNVMDKVDVTRVDVKRFKGTCSICTNPNDAQVGAVINCDAGMCRNEMHVSCAHKYSFLEEQDEKSGDDDDEADDEDDEVGSDSDESDLSGESDSDDDDDDDDDDVDEGGMTNGGSKKHKGSNKQHKGKKKQKKTGKRRGRKPSGNKAPAAERKTEERDSRMSFYAFCEKHANHPRKELNPWIKWVLRRPTRNPAVAMPLPDPAPHSLVDQVLRQAASQMAKVEQAMDNSIGRAKALLFRNKTMRSDLVLVRTRLLASIQSIDPPEPTATGETMSPAGAWEQLCTLIYGGDKHKGHAVAHHVLSQQPSRRGKRRGWAARAAAAASFSSSASAAHQQQHASPSKKHSTSTAAVLTCTTCEKADYAGNKTYSFAGAFVTCDTCAKSYHLACLNPPLKRTPVKGYLWRCVTCEVALNDDGEEDKDAQEEFGVQTQEQLVEEVERQQVDDNKDAEGVGEVEEEEPRLMTTRHRSKIGTTPK